MPTDSTLLVPIKEQLYPISRSYLHREDPANFTLGSELCYLHAVKCGKLNAVSLDPEDHPIAIRYHRNEQKNALRLVAELSDIDFNIIVSPPSDDNNAVIYRDEFIRANDGCSDISQYFDRTPGIKSGSGITYQDLLKNITFKYDGNFDNVKNVLIVDDVFEGGKTIAVIVNLLRNSGQLPESAEIFAACPLLLSK